MAIPDFFGQSQQALQSGLRLGGALQNAETLRRQREQEDALMPYRMQEAEFQSQLRPVQLEQQQLQNQAMAQENERKGLLQDALLLSSLDEEAGKEIIPQLINKYQGNEPVLQMLREQYQATGKDYIKNNLMAVSAFSGKPIDPLAERKVVVQEENSKLRALEASEKSLDRQLKRETNELKRQELEQKIQDRQSEKEKITRERDVEGENAIAGIDSSLRVVDELRDSPGLKAAVGFSSILPTLPGNEAANFEAILEQLRSQQFLNNIEKMKGLGALSEAEGRKVAAAASALDLNMSEDRFVKELNTVYSTLEEAKQRVIKKYKIETPKLEPNQGAIIEWSDL